MNYVLEKINPVTAYSYLLLKHPANRPITTKNVEKLAYQMINGLWKPIPPGIIFGKSGYLLNGHHTLLAVQKAKTTVECLVSYGFDDNLFHLIDTGKSRTQTDSKKILTGLKNFLKKLNYD